MLAENELKCRNFFEAFFFRRKKRYFVSSINRKDVIVKELIKFQVLIEHRSILVIFQYDVRKLTKSDHTTDNSGFEWSHFKGRIFIKSPPPSLTPVLDKKCDIFKCILSVVL